MTNDIIHQGEQVFGEFVKRSHHLNQPNSIADPQYTKTLINKFDELAKQIKFVPNPKSRTEVYTNELKRTAEFCITGLSEELDSATATPKTVMERYGVKSEYLDNTKLWLQEKRDQVLEANKRHFELYSNSGRSHVALGSRVIREKAEALAEKYMETLKKVTASVFPMREFEEMLKSYTISLDSTDGRAYANRQSRVAMLGTKTCLYATKGEMFIDSVEFIRDFGHEVLGHALNYFITEKSDLPFFIKENYFAITTASRESVSKYFEKRLFDLLNTHAEAIKSLEVFEPFEIVYKRFYDTALLDEYDRKLTQLGYWILSNSKMDEYEKQANELAVYSIEPKHVSWFINKHRNDWSKTTGLLLPKVVSELRYSVDVVPNLLENKKPAEMNKFEKALLTGAWSPEGLKEWVNLAM